MECISLETISSLSLLILTKTLLSLVSQEMSILAKECRQDWECFPVVKLRGLPYTATVEDVLMFFSGLEVLDVYLPGETGRASHGDGFVLFSSPLYLQYALQKNGQRMGKRWVEVFKSNRLAYCEAVVGASHPHSHPSAPSGAGAGAGPGVGHMGPGTQENNTASLEMKKEEVRGPMLKMLGLPFSASSQDILSFFSGLEVVESSIQLVKNAEGRPSGTAFVEFASPDEAKAAMSRTLR
eukprot:TRINITY_DN2361_c0_g2_i2.p1 TRINITY_DN2361_c0_g2~~TRINITY_DN2361_c0_g2_i2.p1  ORF type:complete len:239 (+),score=69.14 TRINITY_DN2361_c0_g2_i2:176-892(+)